MAESTLVYCTTQFEGFHKWPKAPDTVKYLRDRHRHIFHVKVIVKVNHTDRDVEFITLKKEVEGYIINEVQRRMYQPQLYEVTMSCEDIAHNIIEYLTDTNYKVHSCEVSEDGENGAIVIC